METIFSACTTAAMVGWLLLLVAPRWRVTQLVSGAIIPLGIALVYLVLIARHLPGARGGFGSLADVAMLFSQPGPLLAGWVHYLAFDLFIGAWETRDAARHRVPHPAVVPCLALTFFFGPIGLLAYFLLRTWRTRTLAPDAG
ncbi:MAG: ABA4-like family protein [Vicinamibacterales bacterium]